MKMDWNITITFFISASAISGIIIFIGKRIVDKSLDIALEKYKSTLAEELETHKIKFGQLHQDRLNVIKLFHYKLYDLQKALYLLTGYMKEYKNFDNREGRVKAELDSLKELLEINQIYFDINICKKIEEIVSEGHRILDEMKNVNKIEEKNLKKEEEIQMEFDRIAKSPSFNNMTSDEIFDSIDKLFEDDSAAPYIYWIKLKNEVQMKIKEARDEMTKEFRKLIGVE